MPNIVISFIKRLKVLSNAYVFGLVTCGSTGNHLSAAFEVKMPDNYQIIYKAPSAEEQLKYFGYEEKRIIEISDIIKKRQTNIIAVKNISRLAFSIFHKKVMSDAYKKDINFKVSNNCTK